MVFKLVRTDTEEPCKIQLPVGKHLIGRGKLLKCEDKRVSRNHGELEVTADKLVIKALHQNPCFILRKGTDSETLLLKQNCTSEISNGDKFGVLPDSYWYEVLHCTDIDYDTEANVAEQNVQVNNDDAHSTNTELIDDRDGEKTSAADPNETLGNNEPDSPSLLASETQQNTEEYPTGQSPTRNDSENVKVKTEPDTPSKRSHSPDHGSEEETAKKIKTEQDIKQDPDVAQAGPSNNQVDSSTDGKPAQPQPNPVLRERCMYGANCYRRNPQHKAQYSHPSDADWGGDAPAPCPYGAACRKRDPRHLRDHTHPPGHAPPSPNNNAGNKRRKPKPRKKVSSDEDEDSPAPGLIVQGKRARKTVKRDNWSDSESEKEKDPYGTDESDEWQPTSDMTDSQLYTQDW